MYYHASNAHTFIDISLYIILFFECCILIIYKRYIVTISNFFPFIYLILSLCMCVCDRESHSQFTTKYMQPTMIQSIETYVYICIISINIAFCPLHFRISNDKKKKETPFRLKVSVYVYMFAVANATHEHLTW